MSKRIVIVIDAGHGGSDPGATGNGLREKDITLAVALLVTAKLKGYDVIVYNTRTTDRFLSLSERARFSNSKNADIFVSIHVNSATIVTANGVETFSFNRATNNNGKNLAQAIQDELVKISLFKSNRGIKTANFAVLRETNAPASLVELGFIKNTHDAKLLKNNLDELAEAITLGIIKYAGLKPKQKAGWVKNNTGWWYRNANGSYPANKWQKINNKWYYFNNRGYMETGWQKVKNTWYYLNANGSMATGWKKVGSHWYYLKSNGAMQTGWVKVKNEWYYLSSGGRMLTGLQKINNKYYYLKSNGEMVANDKVALKANSSGAIK